MPNHDLILKYVEQSSREVPDQVWLRDRAGDVFTEWTWREGYEEICDVAAALEARFGSGLSMAILSRNRAHWFLADQAVIASGNVTIPIFTTLPGPTAEYVLGFSETRVIFLGETQNWDAVSKVVPDGVTIVTLPGVELDGALAWNDLRGEGRGKEIRHRAKADDMVSLVFTSGTTGVPKGVIQTHDSMVVPVARFVDVLELPETPRFMSYLPLSHIAERQLVELQSIMRRGVVTFNESLPTIARDLQEARPHFFFGPPRVWEQLQQMIAGQFGSLEAVDQALADDPQGTRAKVLGMLGFGEARYCLTAAAPTPPALIEWFERLGITLFEGFGQTEAMCLTANTADERRIGSIGKAVTDVECRLTDQDELIVRAPGLSPGYFRMEEKTSELIRDGWLHTGDKARIDDDGFIFLTGRVKDYFKTIQGKFVAPAPIEGAFADNEFTEQICLLGRGYSKTVVVGVLSSLAQQRDRAEVEAAMREQVQKVNGSVEKHARIGAVILATEPWTIDNEVLTPTLKIRREQVESRFGELAEKSAREAAEQGETLVRWG